MWSDLPADCRAKLPLGAPLIEFNQLLVATHAVERHSETAADLRYLQGRATSLGGLRLKCTVIDDDHS
jgi:serine/threonine-protein kinase HipA